MQALEVRRRWPQIHGPLPGPIGTRLAITPCLNTSGALLRAIERTAPRNIALARAVHSRYQESAHLPGTADPGAWRDDRPGRLKLAGFPGHVQGVIREQRGYGVVTGALWAPGQDQARLASRVMAARRVSASRAAATSWVRI
jgi:hypothetical protein